MAFSLMEAEPKGFNCLLLPKTKNKLQSFCPYILKQVRIHGTRTVTLETGGAFCMLLSRK